MPKKLTPQSRIADVAGLSTHNKEALASAGFSLLAHLDDLDFADLVRLLAPQLPADDKKVTKERFAALLGKQERALFEGTVKAGIAVRFKKDALIATVPTMSPGAIAKLEAEGFTRLEHLDNRYFPDIYELIGYSSGKHLLMGLVLAGVNVRFDRPDWQDADWRAFVEDAVARGLLTWEDVAVTVCGEMNTPQVGTAVANAVKHRYPKGETMQNVWRWLYAQDGRCAVSGKRLFLEADHKIPKEQFIKEGKDVKDADTLENFQLLSKRENVIKRGSHKLGGLSFAPAGAAMSYLLLRFRPTTYAAFVQLCREHGLTMSTIRFQEGWAFAAWLANVGEYHIEGEVAPFIKTATDAVLDEDATDTVEAAEEQFLTGEEEE